MPATIVSLPDTLKSVEVVGRQQHESLEIFHLRWAVHGEAVDYLTLDEALEGKWIEVTEFSAHGVVPQIRITNRSNRMVFLMAGEQLVGCKQNRVLNTSIMVPAHGEIPLPVTCVEAGRWGYKSNHFASEHSSSHHNLRAMMAFQAAESYKSSGAPRSDQAAVWGEVSRKLEAVGSRSPSNELQAMYRDYDDQLTAAIDQLPPPSGAHGAVFAIAGKISGADLFDKPETLRKLWSKLVRSCAVDSMEATKGDSKSTALEDVTAWLQRAASAAPSTYASPGLGQDIRLEAQDVFGAGLIVDDQPVHVELFSSTAERHRRPRSRQEPDVSRPAANTDTPVANQAGQSSSTSGNWLHRIFRRKPDA